MSTHKLISLFTITLLCATTQMDLAAMDSPLQQRGTAILAGKFLTGIQEGNLPQIFEALYWGARIRPYTPDEIRRIIQDCGGRDVIYKIFRAKAPVDSFDALKQHFKTVENIEYLLNGVKLVKIPWVGYVPLTRKNIAIGLGLTVAILCAAGHKYFYDCHFKRDNDVDETNQNDTTKAEGDTQNQKPVPAENA